MNSLSGKYNKKNRSIIIRPAPWLKKIVLLPNLCMCLIVQTSCSQFMSYMFMLTCDIKFEGID